MGVMHLLLFTMEVEEYVGIWVQKVSEKDEHISECYLQKGRGGTKADKEI